MEIHPTALVSSDAELADDVIIGAYTIIGPKVRLGTGCVVGPHAVIEGHTSIGARNRIYPFASLGYPPQDISYRDEETQLVLGDGNTVRESVTMHRGTESGGGVTRIGNNNYFMAYVHVAHDCRIGNNVIMANAATLGGHVRIEDNAVLGGLVAIHQFLRIGTFAFVGGKSGVIKDVPPYMLVNGYPAKLFGPNLVGLRRNGFSRTTIRALKQSYRIIFQSNLTLKDAVQKVQLEVEHFPEIEVLLRFMQDQSKRGVIRRYDKDDI
jgi:UDP-N-acetylglucosamine acyltransferase